MTKPEEEILNRNMEQPELQQVLNQLSEGIDELVNFGTKMLKWEVTECEGSDENIPIAMLFRNILEHTDAISILIKFSSIDPCKAQLRVVLETSFQLEYMLKEDTANRALAFLVWNSHRQIKLLKMMDPNEETYKQLANKLSSDSSLGGKVSVPKFDDLDVRIAYLESLLKLDKYKEIEVEYQKRKSEGIKNPNWFQILNPKLRSIEDLANFINKQGQYAVIYRFTSQTIHATDLIQGKISKGKDGNTEIVALRFPRDAQMVTQLTYDLCISVYLMMANGRLIAHKTEMKEWYLSIREFFLKLSGKPLITLNNVK